MRRLAFTVAQLSQTPVTPALLGLRYECIVFLVHTYGTRNSFVMRERSEEATVQKARRRIRLSCTDADQQKAWVGSLSGRSSASPNCKHFCTASRVREMRPSRSRLRHAHRHLPYATDPTQPPQMLPSSAFMRGSKSGWAVQVLP
ncbi:hypothetical protein K466DRAFT_391691 [Polyporus arcularius HHB13444]|uniref:Uncharacterized protein n=1 Tax=Polyporus arcularius HHB13444 TaxID=1314778 RepID=A0A5C3PLW6_9APHY|nr:hypothetical protein K466DRAFT_391691 [Polyporus arcularius HHB13444]